MSNASEINEVESEMNSQLGLTFTKTFKFAVLDVVIPEIQFSPFHVWPFIHFPIHRTTTKLYGEKVYQICIEHGTTTVIDIHPSMSLSELHTRICKRLGIPDRHVTFLFNGHVLFSKNLQETCESFHILTEDVIHVRFYVGNGGMKKRICSNLRGLSFCIYLVANIKSNLVQSQCLT